MASGRSRFAALCCMAMAAFSSCGVAFGQSEKAGKSKAAKSKAQIAKRAELLGLRSKPAELPKKIDAIKPVRKADRVNLPLASDKHLGQPLDSDRLDELVAAESLKSGDLKAEARAPDDVFLRRVYLDLVGRLPGPAEIEEYAADTDPEKKRKVVDKLLAMPQYGEHWARYWRDVVNYRGTAGMNRQIPFRHSEQWLAEQFNANASWGEIVRKIITATGESDDSPEGFFLAAHEGKAEEVAGEASRIFLGIQIACAQCHDHPTDTWKRDQFHEFAAFFGKTVVRPRPQQMSSMGGPSAVIMERRIEYRKPDLEDPTKPGAIVAPIFLTGQAIDPATNDAQRREAAAALIVSKRNTYFAKAFVNRIWCETMGYGFANPVDDLGSHVDVVMPQVFEALARSFAASDYDIKRLLRTIVLSRVYDRRFQEVQSGLSSGAPFRTINPTRLSADQVFDAVDWVLGGVDDGIPSLPRRPNGRGGFKQVFGFDPSANKALVEGSIPQALAMMNNPLLHGRISANRNGTLLNKALATHQNDRDVINLLYLRVLARKPTDAEVGTASAYVAECGDRNQGFEDLLWALLNSTEFLHKH